MLTVISQLCSNTGLSAFSFIKLNVNPLLCIDETKSLDMITRSAHNNASINFHFLQVLGFFIVKTS